MRITFDVMNRILEERAAILWR